MSPSSCDAGAWLSLLEGDCVGPTWPSLKPGSHEPGFFLMLVSGLSRARLFSGAGFRALTSPAAGGKSMRVNPTMRNFFPALAITVSLGISAQANAQTLCPELTRLRGEAQEVLKQSRRVPQSERCYAYNRLSLAWGAVAQYANDNREACHISASSLNDFERYRREAGEGRDNVCAGRPLRPYPAEIIQR
jgi:hypothetical protein